jgi:hypothetical protein
MITRCPECNAIMSAIKEFDGKGSYTFKFLCPRCEFTFNTKC